MASFYFTLVEKVSATLSLKESSERSDTVVQNGMNCVVSDGKESYFLLHFCLIVFVLFFLNFTSPTVIFTLNIFPLQGGLS